MLKAMRSLEEGLLEDDEALLTEEEWVEEEELEESDEEEELAEGEITSTLWPTAGVRSRWLDVLRRSKTVSEVAVALSAFLQHAKTFGIWEEDLPESSVLGKRKAGKGTISTSVPGASPYRRKGKGKGSASVADGARSHRATRRVVSYAE
jgi:hypothetical protein